MSSFRGITLFWKTSFAVFILCLCSYVGAFEFPLDTPPNIDGPCNTPWNQPGKCIDLTTCPYMDNMVKKKSITNDTAAFLILSHCGFVEKSPYVCCALDEVERMQTTTTTQLPDILVQKIGKEVMPVKGTKSVPKLFSDFEKHPNLRLLRRDLCGTEYSERIFGGKEAGLKQFPWMVQILTIDEEETSHRCGGSLINNRYILTAAHCFNRYFGMNETTLRLGEHRVSTDPDCQVNDVGAKVCNPPVLTFGIEEVIVHPGYTLRNRNKTNDIALVRMDREVSFTENILPICLPEGESLEKDYVGKKLLIAGWGMKEDYIYSDVKLWVRVPVTNNSECMTLYKLGMERTQMCAGGKDGEDACSGDSGGPLMSTERAVRFRPGAQWVVVGVVSAGSSKCGVEGRPGLYTRVAPFVNWILDSIKP